MSDQEANSARKPHRGYRRAKRRTLRPWAPVCIFGVAVLLLGCVLFLSPDTSGTGLPTGGGSSTALTSSAGASGSAPSAPTAKPPSSIASTPAPAAPVAQEFDAAKALETIRALAGLGVRKGGSAIESAGAEYLAEGLRRLGYEPVVQEFPLPSGRMSHNVYARLQGASELTLVLGAHMDSKRPAPGANDNASGCGTVLELARDLAGTRPAVSVEFVFFGTEEMVDSNLNHHHYGSRYFVKSLSAAEHDRIGGMISIDMVGVGRTFVSRTMGLTSRRLSNLVIRTAKSDGIRASYLSDPSKAGYSDHEPFERAGIPVSWIEWRDDPNYHTARDTADRIDAALLGKTGRIVSDLIGGLDEKSLRALSSN